MSLVVSALRAGGGRIVLLELNCPGSSYFRPRFVVSTPRFSCCEAFPGLFHHHSDHSGSSHVYRTALFSGMAVL